ncbi:hypothetical protein [Tenacibaculum sp.]|jgi:hypothetical protein|uniref:hypothetical protein n=1 Tax=Tenacibaculum sp. TaxID=1906242 RepID=UPI003AA7CF4E
MKKTFFPVEEIEKFSIFQINNLNTIKGGTIQTSASYSTIVDPDEDDDDMDEDDNVIIAKRLSPESSLLVPSLNP